MSAQNPEPHSRGDKKDMFIYHIIILTTGSAMDHCHISLLSLREIRSISKLLVTVHPCFYSEFMELKNVAGVKDPQCVAAPDLMAFQNHSLLL